MKTLYLLTALLILSTSLLVSTSSRVLFDSVVRDYFGNPVYTKKEYLIEYDGIGFVGGLGLQSANGSSCRRYAAFSDNEVEPGIPVRFHPNYNSDVLQVGDGWRFKVEFRYAPSCAGAGRWSAESPYVAAGVDDSDYFAVLMNDERKYQIAYCGQCALCKDLCSPLGLDGLFMTTGAPQQKKLNVYFVEARWKSRSAE